jgi:hypothetical protein
MRSTALLPGMSAPSALLSQENMRVQTALRMLEKPLMYPAEVLIEAAQFIKEEVKKNEYAAIPFEVHLPVELCARLWAAVLVAWEHNQDEKVLLLLEAWHGLSVWGGKATSLMASLSASWDGREVPPVALAALRLWIRMESGAVVWRHFSTVALTTWIRCCPDDVLVYGMLYEFLVWCGGMSCRHRQGKFVWTWANDPYFRLAVRDPDLVEAVIAALPTVYPERTPTALFATARIVRKTAETLWCWDDLSFEERSRLTAAREHYLSRGRRSK